MNDTYWFVFCKDSLLLECKEDGSYMIPCGPKSPVKTQPWTNILNVSPFEDGHQVKAFAISEPIQDDSGRYEMCGLRPSFYKISNEFYLKAGKCHELLYWD